MQTATGSEFNEDWMIYGANGYTGRILAEEACRRGLRPVLAGRNREAVETMGRELKRPVRVFDCVDPQVVAANLHGIRVVLHCAGPFSATSAPMSDGCLQAKASYLDITGEIAVFERILKKDEAFRQAGAVAISGVGFDVVPSDCLAAMLKEKLPDANKLLMALKAGGSVSPGTLKTMIEGLAVGGVVRENGNLVRVPAAYKTRMITFEKKPQLAMTIPWGDVSTAYHSTGIPNIEFYTAVSAASLRFMKAKRYFGPLFALPGVKTGLKKLVEFRVRGPDATSRAAAHYLLWGEATNPSGQRIELRMSTPDGYALTVDSGIKVVTRVLQGSAGTGAKTPSQAFGANFALSLHGVKMLPD